MNECLWKICIAGSALVWERFVDCVRSEGVLREKEKREGDCDNKEGGTEAGTEYYSRNGHKKILWPE